MEETTRIGIMKKPASREAGFIFTFRCNRMRPCILLCVLMVSYIVGNKRNHDGTTNDNQDLRVDTRIRNHSIHTLSRKYHWLHLLLL